MTDPVYAPALRRRRPPERLLDRLVHALLPAPCLGCGRPLPAAGAPPRASAAPAGRPSLPCPREACAVCAPAARRPRPARRATAAAPAGRSPPAFDRLLALWSYRPPLDAVVQGLKFRRLDYLGRHLAVALAAGSATGSRGFDRVVPVPLHWRRRLARGYNQAERIARPLAGRLGLPFVPALSRRRATPPQSLLGRERAAGQPPQGLPRSPGPSASAASTSCWSTTWPPPARPWTPPPRPSREPGRRPSPPWWRDGRRSIRRGRPRRRPYGVKRRPEIALRAVLPDHDEISRGAEVARRRGCWRPGVVGAGEHLELRAERGARGGEAAAEDADLRPRPGRPARPPRSSPSGRGRSTGSAAPWSPWC